MQKEAPVGQTVKIRLILKPAWSTMVSALGGGPVLVRNGKPIFRANEDFTPDQLLPRTARTAVGQLADGRLLLVTVDGAQPGYSAGATNFELALEMVKLGAVTAAALDGGGSATMAFEGKLLSRPSGAERPIGDALLVSYGGRVRAAAARAGALAERRRRRRAAAARVQGRPPVERDRRPARPRRCRRASRSPARSRPGTYPFDWTGTKPDGTPELEGRWRWVVTATDDAGSRLLRRERLHAQPHARLRRRRSRPTLAVPRPKPRAVATFKLTRAATVTARIKTDLRRRPPHAAAGRRPPAATSRSPGTAAPTRAQSSTRAATSPR